MSTTIASLWDGTALPEHQKVNICVSVENGLIEAPGESCLVVTVDSPFYNNPKPHSDKSCHHLHHSHSHETRDTGCLNVEELWNFEVVEIFIKGRSDKYIEIEMSPHGHYLILACDGYRQCFTRGIEPISYSAKILGNRWTGRLICPLNLLPPPSPIVSAPYTYNAYALYNDDKGERVYCTAFLPPRSDENQYSNPDFHKLEIFKPLVFSENNQSLESCIPSGIWDKRPYICVDMGAMSRGDLSDEELVNPRE